MWKIANYIGTSVNISMSAAMNLRSKWKDENSPVQLNSSPMKPFGQAQL